MKAFTSINEMMEHVDRQLLVLKTSNPNKYAEELKRQMVESWSTYLEMNEEYAEWFDRQSTKTKALEWLKHAEYCYPSHKKYFVEQVREYL
jgi:hypothetical protein